MKDSDKNTIEELAEVIADQSERMRELHRQLDEQNDVIVDYELDKEESEKVTAALCADITDVIDTSRSGGYDGPDGGVIEALESLLKRYFGDTYV